tara:strand:- start:977 stop:1159 length:183 start_codon:yes stop_codon:yes gene_type:complete
MDKERMYDFLTDDLGKLKKNINVLIDMCSNHLHYSDTQKPIDNIDYFFSYWEQHIDKLKK